MAKFATNYTYRTPLRTIEFPAGAETVDAEVIAAAELVGVLEKETDNGDRNDNGPATRSKTGRTVDLKG